MNANAVSMTLFYAFMSAGLRAFISVIDRYQFGIGKNCVNLTNLYNNIATLLFALLTCLCFSSLIHVLSFITNPKVIVFGFLLQLTAQVFSIAYRHMKIAHILVFTKMSDLFTPLFIFLLFSSWNTLDFLFSVATFVICLPVFLMQKRKGHIHLFSAIAVGAVLILQGSLSPWYMSPVSANVHLWLPYTASLIFWRFVFSFLAAFTELKKLCLQNAAPSAIRSQRYLSLITARSALTFGAQMCLVLALTFNKPVIAWPVLNAAGLISVLFSSTFLKEHANKFEITAAILIVLLGLTKVFW